MGLFDRLFKGSEPKDVVTVVQRNPSTGATEIRITATGATFAAMSEGVLEAVMAAYNKYSARKDFDGQMTIVVLGATPASVRAGLPSLKEKLRGVSLGSMTQGPKPLRFLVQEEGAAGELVSGADLLKPK